MENLKVTDQAGKTSSGESPVSRFVLNFKWFSDGLMVDQDL
jgi:hypothetical protein